MSSEIRPGDIYYVDIRPNQVVGHEQHSRRPYVILSRLSLNRGHIVCGVPLTTARAGESSHPPHRIFIPATEIVRDPLFKAPILNCVALTDHVRGLDRTRLEERMGALSRTALAAVGLGLVFLFDL